MTRIVCIGNRHHPEDDAGPRVYSRLHAAVLPPGIELIDGGLNGLNLLRCLEGADRVVFVDTVSGFGRPGELVVLDPHEGEAVASLPYDHTSGLAYLLRVFPALCDSPAPEVRIVGIEGPAEAEAISAAAGLALRLAVEEPVHGGIR
jgi:hydrogenase maturation protease